MCVSDQCGYFTHTYSSVPIHNTSVVPSVYVCGRPIYPSKISSHAPSGAHQFDSGLGVCRLEIFGPPIWRFVDMWDTLKIQQIGVTFMSVYGRCE